MKEQLSSIDWLIDKWNDYPFEIGKAEFRRYLYEAKEMHKKEIIDAYNEGSFDYNKTSEQYYNEKY